MCIQNYTGQGFINAERYSVQTVIIFYITVVTICNNCVGPSRGGGSPGRHIKSTESAPFEQTPVI